MLYWAALASDGPNHPGSYLMIERASRNPLAFPVKAQRRESPSECESSFEVSCLFSDSSLPPAVRDEFHGCIFSSCLCAPLNRWRKPLMYSSSGSCCCWCISSNARKPSTRCFFSITRSVCSNSRTTVRYRTVFKGLQVFILG